jgi:hypothetical protein
MASTSQLPVECFFFEGSSASSFSCSVRVGICGAVAPGTGPMSFIWSAGSAADGSWEPAGALIEARSFFAAAIESSAGGGSPARAARANIPKRMTPEARIGHGHPPASS